MKFVAWKCMKGGPFVGRVFWKSKFHRNHWTLNFWIGTRMFCLSRNAKVLALFAVLAAVLGGSVVHAQTMTLPAATPQQVGLSWTASSSCSATSPCTYVAYRLPGACPASVAGTSGWTALPATAAQVVVSTDATITPGSTYCYVVEAVQGGVNSGPSNAVSVVVPLSPSAPSGLILQP